MTSNGGTVHYTVLYTYDVPSHSPGELSAFRVVRTVTEPGPTSSPLATMDLPAVTPVTLGAAKVFDIGVRVIVDHPVDRLVIEDPLLAGFEVVDASFINHQHRVSAQADSWAIDSQTIYRDKVIAFAQHLGPGIYDVHYLVRKVTPWNLPLAARKRTCKTPRSSSAGAPQRRSRSRNRRREKASAESNGSAPSF